MNFGCHGRKKEGGGPGLGVGGRQDGEQCTMCHCWDPREAVTTLTGICSFSKAELGELKNQDMP